MKQIQFCACRLLFAGLLTAGAGAVAQPSEPQPPAPSEQEAREKTFKETLSNSTFKGRWSSVRDGELGEARTERYTLGAVTKMGGDLWLINARIQYGNVDATVPVPVKVHWVDGTAVIALTDLFIPGVGTYTARVTVQENLYAGTWSGGSHGGVMSGVIVPTPPPKPSAP